MSTEFGQQVLERARQLSRQGIDSNQIAKVLFDQDEQGYNYGIGIILDGQGKPMPTSPVVLEYLARETAGSGVGTYLNSNAQAKALKKAVLSWQRIPEEHWDHFELALPSDAGTGAVRTAVEIALMLRSNYNRLGVEELGWPAYKAIARTSRVGFDSFPMDAVISGEGLLPLYQCGPMNTTGLVQNPATIEARAQTASERDDVVVLDRAYSGFEYAHLLESDGYDEVMRKSYRLQVEPFVSRKVPFLMAVSPTKAFVTFSLRPAGFLLAYVPDPARQDAVRGAINTSLRARGSSFEHPVTRAFVKAFCNDQERLEKEHDEAMRRVAESAGRWKAHVAGTPMAYLFEDNYAGLFRNPPAEENAGASIYNEHLYPVLAEGRVRLNVTGIPDDDELARRHVNVFAAYCR